MTGRSLLCNFLRVPFGDRPELSTEQRSLTPWIDRWTPGDGRKVWVQATVARPDGVSREVVDAREWIETLHDETRWPSGTVFELVTEATS